MSAENVALIKSIYDGLAGGDAAAALALMSPDIVWHEARNFPYADHNPYVGPQAVAEGVLARCAGEWHGFASVMDDLIDGGDRVVALGEYHGINKATGRAMDAQAVHVWWIADGKAVRFQQYIDTLNVARATGAV